MEILQLIFLTKLSNDGIINYEFKRNYRKNSFRRRR